MVRIDSRLLHMYFRDLDPCTYHYGPLNAANWAVPLLTVGWLEYPHAFATGQPPKDLVHRLTGMVEQTRSAYPHYTFRGVADCSLCFASSVRSPGPIWSQENIFVPGGGVVYVAPGGIVHYVESHGYLPPEGFVASVLKCPDVRSQEYREALCESNVGLEPPLRDDEQLIR